MTKIMLMIHQVPVQCINQAAQHYHVPAALVISVLVNERGKPGFIQKNSNGSEDFGPMQINSIWLKKLKPELAKKSLKRLSI